MKIIQILGPSYAGSTALGYALNTVDGYLFGSELRRILPATRKQLQQRPSCDLCGKECEYWSDDLYDRLNSINPCSLDNIYSLFAEMHPVVEALVDDSKSLDATKNTHAEFRILTVKHPIRLLASAIYNDRKKLNINHDSFEAAGSMLEESLQRTTEITEAKLTKYLNTYTNFFESFDDLYIFKNDTAHHNDFEAFRGLEEELSLASKSIKATQFAETPCHSIGGNRAPFWIAQKAQLGKKTTNPRAAYYEDAISYGDWRIDNKYKTIFSENLIDRLLDSKVYKDLSVLLGYKPDEI